MQKGSTKWKRYWKKRTKGKSSSFDSRFLGRKRSGRGYVVAMWTPEEWQQYKQLISEIKAMGGKIDE